MGYSKTFEPSTISSSDAMLCQIGEHNTEYAITNAGLPYVRYLYATIVGDVYPNVRLTIQWDWMATNPDHVWISLRVNGTEFTNGNYEGAWATTSYYANLTGLDRGDTIELWAYATTGATASVRNLELHGVVTPLYGSA